MADSLPLIPEKGGVCTDVRPLLRTVFRELDYMSPLAIEGLIPEKAKAEATGEDKQTVLPAIDQWPNKYKSGCEQIWDREGDIKHQHARRIAREPLPNLYKLYPPRDSNELPEWNLDRGLITRADLKPTIDQDAGLDGNLWIKNILNVSSGNVTMQKFIHSSDLHVDLPPPEDNSFQSYSIGEVKLNIPPPPLSAPVQPATADHILCVPPRLDFVNFVMGQLHTQLLRLINISKWECRLSLTPPKREELDVEISGPRGLTVTSGAAAELKIHFRPSDVRTLHDTLQVRVSSGQFIAVPISCYMVPPILDVSVPSIRAFLSQCTSDEEDKSPIPLELECGGDVIELGARLVGDVHCARVLLRCDAKHAQFFVLTEEAWVNWKLNCVTAHGSVVSRGFVWWPAWWCGGGEVRACVWCRDLTVGAHVTALRLLSSTAVNRELYLLADVLLFKPYHLTIQAHPKDYDICSEDDPACDYYVNVGTAFPHRSLTGVVKLINNSSLVYNYYWITRPWGMCWCWEEERISEGSIGPEDDSDQLCFGAKKFRMMSHEDPAGYESMSEFARLVKVQPDRGQIPARSSCSINVHVPDVGGQLGVQRAVLMLVLKDIPKESFPEDYEPMIIKTKEIQTTPIPGIQRSTRTVCDVVTAQMEVWWTVAPLRFVLEPTVMTIHHSRRLKSIPVYINAWQLFGWSPSHVEWRTPNNIKPPPCLYLTPAQSAVTKFTLPLPSLPNEYPETNVFTLVADNNEWQSTCTITRRCDTRYPSLRPARVWLGVVAPKTHLQTVFKITNDTYQQICYWCEAHRWMGENEPRPACQGKIPCEFCQELACTCALLRPTRGALGINEFANICYDVNAPERDGCVATLVQARRCAPDLAHVYPARVTECRASLLAYRVLAPSCVLRVLPCAAGNPDCVVGCGLDPGERACKLGTAILRPSRALVIERRTCYRLCVTNITPLPTAVVFDVPIDSTDVLKVTFTPNEFSLRGYGKMDVRVILNARRVCERRMFVYRARVMRAHKPLYLVVDTAITGLEISCQVPIGGGRHTDDFVIMRRTQREDGPHGDCKCDPATYHELFLKEDSKRAVVKGNICRCKYEMKYIPPVPPVVKPPSLPLPEDEMSPIDFVTTPPSLTRVCRCLKCSKPYIPDAPDSISLQFIKIPLRTVCERRVVLRNESVVTAHWSCYIRRWTRQYTRTLNKDQWAEGVSDPGIAVSCSPMSGVLAAHAHIDILVQVYADCWGLYWDQILIKVDKVEPIILDVWVEAVGPALQVLLRPSSEPHHLPVMWLTARDPSRTLRVKNVSRSAFIIHAYVTHENDRPQDALPLRLYLRLYDVPPAICPCFPDYHFEKGDSSESSFKTDEMYTGIELHLGPDYGVQCDHFYKVNPEVCCVPAGECAEWSITLMPPPYIEVAPDAFLLLRLIPLDRAGAHWYRVEPPPQAIGLRHAPRQTDLKVSCKEIVIKVCALDLPYRDYLRVRKHFYVQNVGNGELLMNTHTAVPWCVVYSDNVKRVAEPCGSGCACLHDDSHRHALMQLRLPPRSSTKMCVEVCISTMEAWPQGIIDSCGPCLQNTYEPRQREVTPLHLYDNFQVLTTIPLILDIEYPIIKIEPPVVDFKFVTDGDTRKTYVTVSHTSPTETLELVTQWIGCAEFKIWPPFLKIPPGRSEILYIQYTAVWRGDGIAEGCAVVHVNSGAGGVAKKPIIQTPGHCADRPGECGLSAEEYRGWCRSCAAVRATPARDYKCHRAPHDHTDDTNLLPPDVKKLQVSQSTARPH